MKVAVTGATGLIGSALCKDLIGDGHSVVVLTRSPGKAQELGATRIVQWDANTSPPPESLDGLDAVIHLAGEPIAEGRWSGKKKKSIRNSRIRGTRFLVQSLLLCKNHPKVLLGASAIGYYGSGDVVKVNEEGLPGTDFLAEICSQWETETKPVSQVGTRVVLLRTGLVLSTKGGAFPRILLPFQMFVGGPLGSGKQWMSWIHLADEIGAIRHILEVDRIHGPVNLVAPNPVSNEQFSRTLAQVLRRPYFFRVPGFILRFLFGEMANSLLLNGQHVSPRVLENTGYVFLFPELKKALQALISSQTEGEKNAK